METMAFQKYTDFKIPSNHFPTASPQTEETNITDVPLERRHYREQPLRHWLSLSLRLALFHPSCCPRIM